MAFRIVYPRNNTKVTNPEIEFKWNTHVDARIYCLEVFCLIRHPRVRWVRVVTQAVSGCVYRKRLKPGEIYFCRVTAIPRDIPSLQPIRNMPFRQSRFPQRILSRPPGPKLLPLPGALGSTVSTFYVKRSANYLKKCLGIKCAEMKDIKPMIPVTFFFLDRYLRLARDPSAIERTPLDVSFAEAMDAMPAEIRSLGKLSKMLRLYRVPSLEEVKEALFGTEFGAFPEEAEAEGWVDNALEALFAGTWLEELKNAGQHPKTLDLEFKHKHPLAATDVQLDGELRIPVASQLVEAELNPLRTDRVYTLRIIAHFSNESVVVPMRLVQGDDGKYFLHAPSAELSIYDAAEFKAELWEKDPSDPYAEEVQWGFDGVLQIKGGRPVVLEVEPNSLPEDSPQEIRITVRDGGEGKCVLLRNEADKYEIPNDPANPNLRIKRIDQTLMHQVFMFRLTDPGGGGNPGVYDLTFYNLNPDEEASKSVNALSFHVRGYLYTVRIKEVMCLNESDPEWWGNDSISFQTFINTSKFLQLPAPQPSDVYDGFRDGHSRTRFRHKDDYIYPYAGRETGQRRVIEDYLAIRVTIYEHDDLGWLADLIDAVIDFVQSWLAHLVDAFTFGLGGYIILAGLEVSGLNDMREQAIDSMVSGWEVELLHEDDTRLQPDAITDFPCEWSLTMMTDESEYRITFGADRVLGQ